MIIVKVIGGLGNQLFQYAFGRSLAHANGAELKLDTSPFKRYNLHRYSLHHFNIPENIPTSRELRAARGYRPLKSLRFLSPILSRNPSFRHVKETDLSFNPDCLHLSGNLYLEGYWQSEKYFRDIEEIIRMDLSVKDEISGKNREIATRMRTSDSVSIHIRRGDYMNNSITNGNINFSACSDEYYRKAIEFIQSEVKQPAFFVFSDDPAWAVEHYSGLRDVEVITHNDAARNYEDLRLMSTCKHHIIANSSFSWWGAWLNDEPEKFVIAPDRWFNTAEKSKDIIPENWHRL